MKRKTALMKHKTTLRYRLIFLAVLSLAVAAMAALSANAREAKAAPYGAAAGVTVVEQTCIGNGLVRANVAWAPSGWGTQWADVTTVNDNFSSGWLNAGPLNPSDNSVTWDLPANVTHYTRVNTLSSFGWLPSDTTAFRTISCVFTPPSGLTASPLSPTSERVSWTRGTNNQWFCVDTADNVGDLVNFRGSYRWHGCGTMNTVLDIQGLDCDSTYYWRVYAHGPVGAGHSQPSSFETQDCPFTPPSGLRGEALSETSIRFAWSKGTNNQWFCVDTAKSRADLLDFRGSWDNHGCGMSNATLTVSSLTCGTTYYWRVFAFGAHGAGHSNVASTRTRDCAPTTSTVAAPIEAASIAIQESLPPKYVLDVTAGLAGGCAEPASHQVERDGHLIRVKVLNSVKTGPCIDIYDTYQLSIPLGSNFQTGATYTVNVNGMLVHFQAK